jgi:hypothetical protein
MGDISVPKGSAKIITLSITVNGTVDTTNPMTADLTGSDVAVRVMTAEDGAASRRIKINAIGPGVGPARAIVQPKLLGQTALSYIVDVAAPLPPTVVGTVTDVSGVVPID